MENMSKAKPIQTTKWGTACAQCASAKAKCSRKPTDIPGSKCDRCERLLKTCTDQVHKPRKPRQPRQQKKFSDEASYGGFDSRHASPLIPSSEGSPSTSPAMSMCGSISHPPSPQQWLLNTSPLSLQSSPSEQRNRLLSVPGLYPMYAGEQQQSDEDLLQTYRNELMPRFPFVLVPTEATADDLNMHRPFLMASIRLVASLRNPQYIRGQVGQIMTHFADSIVVRGERNMDLLFGILVLVGWYHYCQIQHSQLNSLLCLTESLIADLGIGQGRRVRDGSDMPSSRNDEQRALLGAWFLRSCVATQFNQLKPTPFTPYIQQCLGEVNRDRNNESDELLVLLVRIQHLTNSISPSSPDHVLSSTWKGLESVIQDAPRELSKDTQVTIALNAAALRLQRYGSARFNHTPSTIKSWLDSWLSRLSNVSAAATSSIAAPLPTAPVFHLVYTIAVLEANSTTPREPDLWGDQFWNMLQEKIILSRGLISELANLVDCGDMTVLSSSRTNSGHSSIPDITLLHRSSTPDIRLSTPSPGNMSAAAIAVSLPPSTCTTGHHSLTSMPLPQQISMVQHGYPQIYHHSQVVDDELQWMSSQWSTTSDPNMGGMVSVPVTEAHSGGSGQIDPALWYDPMAGYGQQAGPSSQQSHYGHQG